MPKSNNVARLADRYQLQDLEAGVDAEKVAAFLSVDGESSNQMVNAQPSIQNAESVPRESEIPPDRTVSRTPELWTSRTIRLRQSTATGLTMAACGQKSKQVEGKLSSDAPITVQEIADLGIRLALAELGYQT